ncbi:TrkH family potassium uptake protein [Ancylomarina euxinus]|uniref:TrkH family potassium uptake protein n=1 Tax=Ancylomarina euxinus TaxID=2283627 RepID=A0A425Y2U8_9BACT|nr:TrkH family potassium uptake protein [Ancylomarina euxinus]MCZ4693240.1 TrkH family potassium uptake protein [Ancylomarina euxinus]MUP15376.1 TrkH family potassium uptake protein [Ancylomarina euxinus]RRG22501.1 TrkH family potassium uptake protein [Ancylomarina euxinus]
MNLKFVLNIIGRILLIIAAFMMTIVPWVIYFHENSILFAIEESIAIPLITGLVLILLTKGYSKEIGAKEAYILASSAWIIMGVAGSLPFWLSHTTNSFIDALFESISGFTTTGSSILTDIEAAPKAVLYWRSLTHWIGGMGIIVLTVAIFPSLRVASYRLFSSESSGIDSSKLMPKTSSMAKRLWGIYISLTAIMTVILMLGGVNFYESICHAFASIATGGFSTKNASAGFYTPFVQYVMMFFMLISGINFALHYGFIKGRFKDLINNIELRTYLSIIFLVGTTISLMLYFKIGLPFEQAFRDSFFQVISVITATGFASADYLEWNQVSWLLIFLLMFVGACVGSTGGGIKVIRHVIAVKVIFRLFLQQIHPCRVKLIQINKKSIDENKVHSIVTFIFIYLFIFFIGGMCLLATGLDPASAFSASITSMGGIGPGLGTVGPASNFAHLSDVAKIILPILMIIGRLEVLSFLVIFTPSFWKGNIK